MNTPPYRYELITQPTQVSLLVHLLGEVFGHKEDWVVCHVDDIEAYPSRILIGAYHDAQLVGGLVAFELALLRGEKELYVYDIAVLPAFQKQGIGTGLMMALQAQAERRGASMVFVEAEADDEEAVAFYRSLLPRGGEEIAVRHFNFPI